MRASDLCAYVKPMLSLQSSLRQSQFLSLGIVLLGSSTPALMCSTSQSSLDMCIVNPLGDIEGTPNMQYVVRVCGRDLMCALRSFGQQDVHLQVSADGIITLSNEDGEARLWGELEPVPQLPVLMEGPTLSTELLVSGLLAACETADIRGNDLGKQGIRLHADAHSLRIAGANPAALCKAEWGSEAWLKAPAGDLDAVLTPESVRHLLLGLNRFGGETVVLSLQDDTLTLQSGSLTLEADLQPVNYFDVDSVGCDMYGATFHTDRMALLRLLRQMSRMGEQDAMLTVKAGKVELTGTGESHAAFSASRPCTASCNTASILKRRCPVKPLISALSVGVGDDCQLLYHSEDSPLVLQCDTVSMFVR